MTDVQRAQLTKELIHAQDAAHSAFQEACKVGNLDVANAMRKCRKQIGEAITAANGGPVKLSKAELLGAFR